MINQFLFDLNQEQQAQEIIIHQKKTGKPTFIVYRTGSFVLMGKSSTELTNKRDNDNYLELMNNQFENLRNYEKYLLLSFVSLRKAM